MYPTLVATQLRATILDYLKTTFSFRDAEFEQAFFDFIDGEKGLIKGPYLDVRLPFRQASNRFHPLEIAPPFKPYQHQLNAFDRLHSQHGHQPQSTLVVTGTGSGKTECFLYPILDHCYRTRDEPGIKAIILYPMNALAADQARRLADLIHNDERLKSTVSAGLYIGGQGQHQTATTEHLVDDRTILRRSPPNILLTNYKMLDFLLQRPEDRPLWSKNTSETLRYLVLDELHTYDGAQGSDVACLIRRLKARLETPPGGVCSVGTSATIGSEDKRNASSHALVEFARQVFDDPLISDSAIISEDRYQIDEVLGETDFEREYPDPFRIDEMRPEHYKSYQEFLKAQIDLWFNDREIDPVVLGERLLTHPLLSTLLAVLEGKLRPLETVCHRLSTKSDFFRDLDNQEKEIALNSFIALISYARTEQNGRFSPLFTCQVQVWVRELRRLQRKVGQEIEFFWPEEKPQNPTIRGLPIAYCRECGVCGVGTTEKEGTNTFVTGSATIGEAFLQQQNNARFVLLNQHQEDGQLHLFLNPQTLTYQHANEPSEGEIPIAITAPVQQTGSGRKRNFLGECPSCGAEDSISLLGSRAATLSSVAISLIFNSPYNQDKKLLAFTDSVQDASHRSGFFGARTYRFHLRTQLQSVVLERPEGIRLSECGAALIEKAKADGGNALISFWPSDLEYLDSYQAYREDGKEDKLIKDLESRLSWEVSMEYGYSALVGRTLQKTGCSTVFFDPESIRTVAESLSQEIIEKKLVLARKKTPADLVHFLSAFLNRLRVRGGIYHPLLKSYIENDGNVFLLMKRRNPLFSPFSPRSPLPRFLHNQSTHKSFDTYRASSHHWYRDWAVRCLGVDPKDRGIGDLYETALKLLEEQKLVISLETGKGLARGICPEALFATHRLGAVQCDDCHQHITLAATDAAQWEGRACPRFRCSGVLKNAPITETYYSRIYNSGYTTRVVSHEHTGLLERQEREQVEESFKRGGPGDPNLLVCTPTLELGVDVGDLSAAMVCSVPPNPANFIQRMGRAGRKTGNAFCLTIALNRPHDLYFFTQPEEMMAGVIAPPACFLNAPEMLKRQMVAFTLDSWARQETELKALPNKAARVLGAGRKHFPGRAIEFYRKNREALTDTFLKLFHTELDEENSEELREFGLSDAIPELLNGAFDKLTSDRDELKRQMDKIRAQLQKLEGNPIDVEDLETEKKELDGSRRMLSRLRDELNSKYPLNVLTDYGVLPNYAFPEPGVTLRSVVKVKNDGPIAERHEVREYMRAASSAIREFAPFSRFYADGKKIQIRQVEIGKSNHKLIEKWRFCSECSYAEIVTPTETMEACPRCQSDRFKDVGQVREMVPFRQAYSYSKPIEVATVDESEERELTNYNTLNLIDVGPEHTRGAKVIDELPFGYELLHELTLREVNFGQPLPVEGRLRVAGQELSADGFIVCSQCGGCQEKEHVNHAPYCTYRSRTKNQKTENILLYREIKSEAIRFLLPIAEHQLENTRASFKAALELGLRLYFGGDPGHLLLREVSEPVLGSNVRRHFLVLYDAVPGGTGYLSDLAQGDTILTVLEKALNHMEACRCNQEEDVDGCYRCVFGYQSSRALPNISRRNACHTLAGILELREKLQDTDTLSTVSLDDKLESELEYKFIAALQQYATDNEDYGWKETARRGRCWSLTLPSSKGPMVWRIEPQRKLGETEGVSRQTKPDFLMTNTHGALDAPQIAIYCDGHRYHVCPQEDSSRLEDDIKKRSAVINSTRLAYVVWSITWDDIDEFLDPKSLRGNTAFQNVTVAALNKTLELRQRLLKKSAEAKNNAPLKRDTHHKSNLQQLLEFLKHPQPSDWKQYLENLLITQLFSKPHYSRDALHQLERRLGDPEPLKAPLSPEAAESMGNLLGWVQTKQGLTLMALLTKEQFSEKKFHQIRVIMRLEDDTRNRCHPGFKESWQEFLSTWNLLQFHKTFRVVCGTDVDIETEAKEPEAPMSPEKSLKSKAEESYPDIDPDCEDLRLQLVAADILDGEVGYELIVSGRTVTHAEIGWEDKLVAVILSEEDRRAFEAQGWRVFLPEESSKLVEVLSVG